MQNQGERSAKTRITPISSVSESFKGFSSEQELKDHINLITTLQNVKGMLNAQNWSIPELIFGIKWLHKYKKKRDFTDFMNRAIDINDELYETLLYYIHHAEICNCVDTKSRQEFLSMTGISDENLIEYFIHSTSERNGYCLVLDHERKELVLYINGTQTLNDMMLDLHGRASAFLNGHAHHGMAMWAKWFHKNKTAQIVELLNSHEGYNLLICGHSLGAATSVLAGFLMREEIPDLKVLAIAVPKCVSESLIEESEKFVTTFINMDDLVPLLSEHTWTELRQRVAQFDWKKEIVNDISTSAPFKAIMKIAPPSFQNLLSKYEKPREELNPEVEALSEKDRIEYLYTRARTSSITTPPGSPNPDIETETLSVEVHRQRAISAPIPLGSLIPQPSPKLPQKPLNAFTPKPVTVKKTTKNRFSFFWRKSTGTSTTTSATTLSNNDIELSTPTSNDAAFSTSSNEVIATVETSTRLESTKFEECICASSETPSGTNQDLSNINDNTSKSSTTRSEIQEAEEVDRLNTTSSDQLIGTQEEVSTSTPIKRPNSLDTPKEPSHADTPTFTPKASNISSNQKPLLSGSTQKEPTTPNSPFSPLSYEVIPLYNPGKIYYIRIVDGRWYMTLEKWNSKFFEKLEFNRTFLRDHLSVSYLNALQNILALYRLKKDMDGKEEAVKKLLSVEDDLL